MAVATGFVEEHTAEAEECTVVESTVATEMGTDEESTVEEDPAEMRAVEEAEMTLGLPSGICAQRYRSMLLISMGRTSIASGFRCRHRRMYGSERCGRRRSTHLYCRLPCRRASERRNATEVDRNPRASRPLGNFPGSFFWGCKSLKSSD